MMILKLITEVITKELSAHMVIMIVLPLYNQPL